MSSNKKTDNIIKMLVKMQKYIYTNSKIDFLKNNDNLKNMNMIQIDINYTNK